MAGELHYDSVEVDVMNSFSNEYLSTGVERCLRQVAAEEIRRAFGEHLEKLEGLALFLTSNEELATVCMADACALATTPNDVFVQPVGCWMRSCTLRSVIEMQHVRVAELARIYERKVCRHHEHAPLASGVLDLLYERPEELGLRIDVLCRAALVLRGMEGYSPTESARVLGVSETAVEAAYCAALESLEILTCEMLVDSRMSA